MVFGLLYDRRDRTFPFCWKAGRMTVLLDPDGRRHQADVPDRHTVSARGEMVGTLIADGQRQAVRWSPDGRATLLHPLPGHARTNTWSIDRGAIVGDVYGLAARDCGALRRIDPVFRTCPVGR